VNFDYSAQVLHKMVSAELSLGEGGVRLPTQDPSHTCAALSLELYFKSLICLEKGNVPRDHRLVELFAHISLQSQLAIRKAFAAEDFVRAYTTPSDKAYEFDAILREANTAFINYRYSFEGVFGSSFLIWPVAQATRKHILSLRPSWATALDWPKMPPIGPVR